MKSIEERFYAGDYQGALSLIAKQSTSPATSRSGFLPSDSLKIGSLVFTGDILEAEGLFRRVFDVNFGAASARSVLDREAEARFFLGVGLVRSSQNSRAAGFFAKNFVRVFRRKKGDAGAIARFYALQGAALYRFYRTRFQQCAQRAEEALVAASEADFDYGRVLALDLLAHSLCQLGQVSKGLHCFSKAEKTAAKLGNGGILTAIRISKLRFQSQFGLLQDATERELKKAVQALVPTDTYSRSELKLELARQLVLAGRNQKARELLESCAEEVHRHGNRRQSSVYCLRFAHSMHLSGESSAALTLVRSARAGLDPRVDRLYVAQLDGLERRIRGQQDFSGIPSRPVNAVDGRIRSRPSRQQKGTEDLIGDWLDRVAHEGEAALPDLLKTRLHGLIPIALRFSPSESLLVLGPIKGMALLSCRGDVHVISAGWSLSLYRLAEALAAGGYQNKETLVQRAWGYAEYHPLRHDGLIHGSLARMRKLLGDFSGWIEGSESGYRWNPAVQVLDARMGRKKVEAQGVRRWEVPTTERARESSWNSRQFQAIQLMKRGEFLGVTEYSRRFKTTKVTASRDLRTLHSAGAIQKFGTARATKYGWSD